QIRQAQQENDFFETDINIWKEELTELKNELTQPSTVRIQHGSKPLVTDIIIDTLDRSNHPVGSVNNDNIPCEICKKEIKWCNYDNHMRACIERELERERERERKRNESRAYDQRHVSPVIYCKYCNEERPDHIIAFHERICRNAPVNTT
ncbi:unnamed protein product, partial [Adineta steineri]